MVLKYRDVIRMTLFGRHDKLLTDTTSIYQGYDRYATTITGGGINSVSLISNGTVYFTSYPIVYFSNALNFGATSGTTTLSLPSAQMSPIYSVSLTSGGSGFTSAPNVIISGTGTGAVVTSTISGNAITSLNIQNGGTGFTAAPTVSFNGGGFINITAQMNGINTIINNLYHQAYGPVLWTQSIEKLPAGTVCVEVGPGKVLMGLVRKINKDIKVVCLDKDEALIELASVLGV